MTIQLSQRSGEITQSEIRAMTIACRKVNGVNLAQGVCDLGVPEPVARGVTEAIQHGYNTYTRYDGLPELRQAIAWKMQTYNGMNVDPEGEIVVSAGSTGSFYAACLAMLNPGDEVILFEPYYGYHVNMVRAVGAVPRFVRMKTPDWSFSEDQLAAALSERTRAIVVCTPGNPSGKVYTESELGLIAAFAVRHDLIVMTDEIYEYFLYDGRRHISPATLPGLADRTITISGYSKTFSITGWRIGYSVCRKDWAQAIGYMNDLVYVCAPAPLQIGVATGINELSTGYYSGLCADLAARRELICTTLARVGLAPYVPQGSYYVLADVARLPGATSRERAMYLLEKTGVASVPGSAFYDGAGSEGIARFCFAKTDDDLADACERLTKRL